MIRSRQANGATAAGGFTLIEMMVVAAIIAVLVVAMAPAIKGILQTSQVAQADNMVRAVLYSVRNYAIRRNSVAAVRFQDDGNMVMTYAWNQNAIYTLDNYINPQPYKMVAIEGEEPAKLPDPWRVTPCDHHYPGIYCDKVDYGSYGACWVYAGYKGGGYAPTWDQSGPSSYQIAPEWLGLNASNPNIGHWFAFPVAMFSPRGRVLLADCRFPAGDNYTPQWYPSPPGQPIPGSFGMNLDDWKNPWPMTSENGVPPYKSPPEKQTMLPLTWTNEMAFVGGVYSSYKNGSDGNPNGRSSHFVPMESPTVTSALRLFNYFEFMGTTDKWKAVIGLVATSNDVILDVNTGLPVRIRATEKTNLN